MDGFRDRKRELIKKYKEDECKLLLEILRSDKKREDYLVELAESIKFILEEYFTIKKRSIYLSQVSLSYILLSAALEGSLKLYFLSRQFADFLKIEPSKRTLSRMKDELEKDVRKEIEEELDYLIFLRNHFIHFPLYFTSFPNDERVFLKIIKFFMEKSGFSFPDFEDSSTTLI